MSKKKIKKIFIPNRGEIAVRIQRTCRELDIPAVAVFSEPDRHALHVRYADEAYPLPGASPLDTYLNQDLLLDIAWRSGADAVHPGYGFLSENPGFARKCRERGLVFIGPPPEAMELMGLKTEARRLMSEAGVPIVPGTEPLQDAAEAAAKGEAIGCPLLLKASAGGGGKGMRLVESLDQLPAAFEACRREAQSAFGDGRVYIEKFVSSPRHIEFQVMADRHGNVIHLNERECSVQRRHQKIIEETPSPILDPDLRERMGAVAVQAARACNYENAGTVEFLVDADKNFYFLEMNTRLQVEHPITEMVTGIDLVEMQVRIAEGEPLEITGAPIRGAAMECRIYAEDPENNFMPSPGLIKSVANPGGPGVRNDSGVYGGFLLPMEYDPMISKLVVHGENRRQVMDRMLRALEEYHLLGIRTNISYLRQILRHTAFVSGDYDTRFISTYGHELPALEQDTVPTRPVALIGAAILDYMHHTGQLSTGPGGQVQSKKSRISPWKMAHRTRQMGG